MPKTYGKRICPFCNKEFEATHPRQRVCKDDHFAPCPRCGKPVKIVDKSYEVFVKNGPKLCKECSIAVVSEKRKNRSAEEKQKTLEKRKQTNLERYGAEFASQNPDIHQKAVNTFQQNYGVDWAFSSSEIQAKAKATYQVNHPKPVEHEELDLPCSNDVLKTPVDNEPLSTPEIYSTSEMEKQVFDFIRQLNPYTEIGVHNHRLADPAVVSLHLPNFRLAIDCISTESVEELLNPPSYQLKKSKSCEKYGVFLFHIFGYEWTHRQDQVKSMLRNLIHCSERKIYARQTHVEELSAKACSEFLDKNHRQGPLDCKIRLGLISNLNQELVAVMTFNKPRPGMGQKSKDCGNVYELSRFCNLINTRVIGGASKLFSYFCKMYHPDKVFSFSDRAHTRGSLYETLGFHKVSDSEPGYGWVDCFTDTYLHRIRCQKSNLPKLFNEPDLDIVNQTETEIMRNHGFVKVFDCGVVRWEYLP